LTATEGGPSLGSYVAGVDRLILDLAHGLTAPDSEVRERSADEVTDVHRALGLEEIAILVHVLVAARLVEDVKDA
jgi:hypothetical protein